MIALLSQSHCYLNRAVRLGKLEELGFDLCNETHLQNPMEEVVTSSEITGWLIDFYYQFVDFWGQTRQRSLGLC